MDLEKFGEITDDFITKSDIKMLIELPEGTQEPKITGTDISTVDFFILTKAVAPVFARLIRDMGGPEAIDAEGVLDGLWELMKVDCMKALRGEGDKHVRDTDDAAAGRDGGEAADL